MTITRSPSMPKRMKCPRRSTLVMCRPRSAAPSGSSIMMRRTVGIAGARVGDLLPDQRGPQLGFDVGEVGQLRHGCRQ